MTDDIGQLTIEAQQEERPPSNEELVDEMLERGEFQDALNKVCMKVKLSVYLGVSRGHYLCVSC